VSWDVYLTAFHARRPGITEAILRRALDGGGDPYAWLAEAIPGKGLVLDLGCGSAPLGQALRGRRWAGLDVSAAELAAARSGGARPLLRATASAIPLRDGSVDVVACSMSLMVTTPLPQVLAEITRVLRPGGLLAAVVPAGRPLRPGDRVVLAGLLAALVRAPGYPADPALRRLPALLGTHGLRIVSDDRRRFGYRLRGRAAAEQLLASLYLPGLPPARYRAAQAWLRLLALFRAEFPVPLHRIIAVTGPIASYLSALLPQGQAECDARVRPQRHRHPALSYRPDLPGADDVRHGRLRDQPVHQLDRRPSPAAVPGRRHRRPPS
jgi:SAM-dependent methyltransferase